MVEGRHGRPVADIDAASMFYECALDLLAQTEAQHRAVVEAHTRLETCIAEWSINPPTPEKRRERLSVIATLVHEVTATLRAQRGLAVAMQRAMSSLQANGESS